MLYGAEIWGWKERETIEKLQEKYIRWTLGLDWRTPAYMVREEVKWELARKCCEEIRRGKTEETSRWEEERKRFFEKRGFSAEAIEVRKIMELDIVEEIARRDKDIQKQEREEKMRGSKYNEGYMRIKPKYLREGGKERKVIRIARFRLGNEMRGGRY
ncbi:hypothetical protein ALC62_08717 [Cyphomyrmex costatus]|uniref:Uncharacterized protein n=1 Tax=Cyphomyrmex costatus TaxID=456900 RepID=A0A151IGG7_9HYME|nr:hypothetical protein ALC62_08717 [Cyphomyrmex costatus]